MDFKQLECFISLAETLNFTTTAQKMYLTQPAVSNKIKQLEKEIGFQLFKRTKRTVELTGAGFSFYEDMKEILVMVNQSIVKARNFAERFDDRYVIAYENNDLAIRYLSRIVKDFMEIYPNVQVELKMVDFKRKNTLFLEDKVDFLFTVRDSIMKIPKTEYLELYIGRFICIVSDKNEISCKPELTFSDLNGQTLVLLNLSLCPEEMKKMEDLIIEFCPLSPILYVDNQLSGCTLASCGLGIAIMPDFVYHTADSLCLIPLKTAEKISYGAVWHEYDHRKQTRSLLGVAHRIFGEVEK